MIVVMPSIISTSTVQVQNLKQKVNQNHPTPMESDRYRYLTERLVNCFVTGPKLFCFSGNYVFDKTE
jgi:hypothetical protein